MSQASSDNDNFNPNIKKSGKLLTLSILSAVALAGCATTSEAAPQPVVEQTQDTVTNEGTETPVDTEQQAELSADKIEIKSGLSSEELGKLIVGDRLTEWSNAGAYEGLLMDTVNLNESFDEYLPKIVEKNGEIFADALFVPDWENNPELANDVEGQKKMNLALLENYVYTAWKDDASIKEGTKIWNEVSSVKELASTPDGNRTIAVTFKEKINTELSSTQSPPNIDRVYTISTTVVDGKEKISAIDVE